MAAAIAADAGRWRGKIWQGRGPDRLLGELGRRLKQRQGRFLLGAGATSLRLENGRIGGVIAHKAGDVLEIGADDAVVIADGGFPGNPELFRNVEIVVSGTDPCKQVNVTDVLPGPRPSRCPLVNARRHFVKVWLTVILR